MTWSAPDALVGTVLALAFLAAKMRGGGTALDASGSYLVLQDDEDVGTLADENGAEHDAWAAMYDKARGWVEAALREIGATETVDLPYWRPM